MGSRKVNTEGIDEELLLASIGRRTQDGTLRPAQEVPAARPTEEEHAAHRRTGTISCATRNTGKSAEGKWTPEKAGRGLQRAIPAPQRDKDPPMCLYQP
ncbi:Conjugative transposon protein TraB [Bacteroides xylanisolvens SD CC 1b]|uniref:Conjugative transposon protein TraB n=1 Tax=Bacteroides xylanisolvens SD CC 1b TaxID=702447 RepID=W6NYD8_9BACE|nr:Conjugative transposon protein TraB [Bacteroides xylanisolvens SD CC 1b]